MTEPTNNKAHTSYSQKAGDEGSAPNWLDESIRTLWSRLPRWREAFFAQQAKTSHRLVRYSLKSNILALIVSALVIVLIWAVSYWLTGTSPSMSDPSLSSVGGIATFAGASFLAIILAFVTFLLGTARNRRERARENIRMQIGVLDSIREEIFPFAAGPRGGIGEPLESQLRELARETESFDNAIKSMVGRFSRAAEGTYYPSEELASLDAAIHIYGGEWFSKYANIAEFKTIAHQSFCRRVWKDAMSASSALWNSNEEVRRAQKQIRDSLEVAVVLPSLTVIVFLSIGAVFLSNVELLGVNFPDGLNVVVGALFLVALSIHVAYLARLIWRFVWREVVVSETNRQADLEYSRRIEQGPNRD